MEIYLKYSKFYDQIAQSMAKEKGIGKGWGWHYIGDFAFCDNEIDDEKDVEKFMNELVEVLKMKKVDKLWIKTFPEKPYPHPAISAVQVIETSTLVFHGDNEYRAIFIDCFSCAAFNPDVVPPLVEKYFKPQTGQGRFFLRNIGQIEDKGGV